MKTRLLILMLLVSTTGCANRHLQIHTVRHAATLPDIYEVQVLNNLARFASNPEATPHFELPTSGGTSVNDSAGAGPFALNAFRTAFSVSGGRATATAWTLAPVTDPDKLRRMKCAFQRAVNYQPANCDNCCALQEAIIKPVKNEPNENGVVVIKSYQNGTTTAQDGCNAPCARPSCFFVKSESRREAVASGCVFGEHGGLYVWVPNHPASQKAFSDLVFDVLTYANKSPAPPVAKEVTLYLDAHGRPSKKDDAFQVVSAVIPLKEKNLSLEAGKISKGLSPSETINAMQGLNSASPEMKLQTMQAIQSMDPTIPGNNESELMEGLRNRRPVDDSYQAQEAARQVESYQKPRNSGLRDDFQRRLNLLERFTLPGGSL